MSYPQHFPINTVVTIAQFLDNQGWGGLLTSVEYDIDKDSIELTNGTILSLPQKDWLQDIHTRIAHALWLFFDNDKDPRLRYESYVMPTERHETQFNLFVRRINK